MWMGANIVDGIRNRPLKIADDEHLVSGFVQDLYEVSRNIDSELCKRALSNALALRGKHEGPIFHSDRGSQYSSRAYKRMLQENGIEGSMSAPGCPYDNSCVESFFATLRRN